jgi:Glycosyltransferases involved in cell wall biogenesis
MRLDMGKISVVIPIYKVESYLKECVDSIFKQTYKNLEIILVDDGSPDNCPQICDQYAAYDNRVKVIHKVNSGLSDARNVGIEIATGKYITFLDGDDFIKKDMIEYLFNKLHENNADIAFCQRENVNESGDALSDGKLFKDFVVRGNQECMHQFLTSPSMDTVAWGKLYRLDLFTGVRYPVGKYHEDVYTTYKLVAKSNCIAVGSERMYCYRIRSESITSASFKLKHLDAIEANKERREFIKEYFPMLTTYANAGVVYAANQCTLRLAKHKSPLIEDRTKKDIIKELQQYYRMYELDFLKGSSGIPSKLFSLAAFINLRFTIWIIGIK